MGVSWMFVFMVLFHCQWIERCCWIYYDLNLSVTSVNNREVKIVIYIQHKLSPEARYLLRSPATSSPTGQPRRSHLLML